MEQSQATSNGPQRQNSARDKTKPRLSLGPDTTAKTPQPPRSYNLVLCGALRAKKDGYIFSDFLGFCMALKQQQVEETFWSCFPLKEHFEHLESDFHPPIKHIKFGKYGPNRDQALHEYSRFDFDHREPFFTQVSPRLLKDDTLRWIKEKTKVAKSGDVVNVIIESHGCKGGGVRLGDFFLWPHELTKALRDYEDEVQVNIITGACYGGVFVNIMRAEGQYYRYVQAAGTDEQLAYGMSRSVSGRVRNSRFAQAVCMSLARLDLPGLHTTLPAAPQIRLIDHDWFIRDQMIRNITPRMKTSTPSNYHTNPVTLQTVVKTLIFRDFADVLRNPASTHRRRRIEWPSLNENLRLSFRRNPASSLPRPDIFETTKSMLHDEFAKCSFEQPLYGDDYPTVYFFISPHKNDFGPLLKILYWRGRQQSTIYDIFQQLLNSDYVRPESLIQPMHMTEHSSDVVNLSWLLSCYQGPSTAAQEKFFTGQDIEYPLPFDWLATMIVRSSADIESLLHHILSTGYLGDVDERKLEEWREHCQHKYFKCDANACACEPGLPSGFGFWLPHGVRSDLSGMVEDMRAGVERFNRIEKCFQEWFGLSQSELYTEAQQMGYYEAHPKEYPE